MSARRKRSAGTTAGPGESPVPEVMPRQAGAPTVDGEYLVQLEFSPELASTRSIRGRRKRGQRPRTRLRWKKRFDALLERVACVDIRRIHDELPLGGSLATVRRRMDSTFLLRVDPQRVDAAAVLDLLRDARDIEAAEVNRFYFSAATEDFNGLALNATALAQIAAPAALTRVTGDPAVRVAVLDSGVDIQHPLLRGIIVGSLDTVDLTTQNPPSGFRWAGDFKRADPDPSDDLGHGTHVAGIIHAQHAAGGIARGCRLLAIRVLARLETQGGVAIMRGAGKSDDIARGVRAAMDRGAHVINMSYANAAVDAPGISLLERNEIRLAIQRGALPVAAMGNDGPLAREAFPGALADGSPVVAVGAIDSIDQRLPDSQRGSHLSVVAPGARIVSTLPSGHLGILSGTSMAAAYVSGAAALAQSFRRQRGKSFLAPLDLKNAILASARRLPFAASPRNNDFGHGCLDVNRLLDVVKQLP